MDDISKLLKEAKPLYFARKKRNERIKTSMVMLIAVFMIGWFYPHSENMDYDYNYFLMEAVASVNENNVSAIEEMGLPTDEYGLLMVG